MKIIEIKSNDIVITTISHQMNETDFNADNYKNITTKLNMFNIYTKSIFIFDKKLLTLKKIKTPLPYDLEVGNKDFLKIRNREKLINGLIQGD